jgi:hypothetical protein
MYEMACEIYAEENMGYCDIGECCKVAVDDVGRGHCLTGDSLGWAKPMSDITRTTPTLSPAELLTRSAFELDDSIMFHNDDSKDLTIDISMLNDDAQGLTWLVSVTVRRLLVCFRRPPLIRH